MVEKIINNAHLYTDIQGLGELKSKASSNPNMVAHEAAQQFESLLVQMLLKSMRAANQAFSSGFFNSDYMNYYQDFFDKQLSMVVSQQGMGFAENIETNLLANHAINTTAAEHEQTDQATAKPIRAAAATPPSESKSIFASAKDFIAGLWDEAKTAATKLNVSPGLLLAQAALETNWGKSIIKSTNGESTNNLFNIKADHNWSKEKARVTTLEQKDGTLTKQKANFKKYASFADSFHDYVELISKSSRYKQTLAHQGDPEKYMHSLQHAGYATDPNYAEKVLAIFHSTGLKSIIKDLK